MNYLFKNAYIYGQPSASAVLVEDSIIRHVGSFADCQALCRSKTEIIDISGKALLPAFTDAHTHFVEYAKGRIYVNLTGCSSIAEISVKLSAYKANLTWEPQWILGGGWNRNALSNPRALDKSILDQVFPDIPAALFSKDYHSKLCNSKALAIAGIDRLSPDPEGGRIERDASGEPTGVFYETAAELLDKFIVPVPEQTIIQAVRESVEDMYRWGLAGFHVMENQTSRDILLTAQSQGSRFRFCWHFQTSDLDDVIQAGNPSYYGDVWYKLGGLKLFTDGSLGSRTAAMYDDYSGEPGNRGILRYSDEELFALAEKAAQHGLSTTIHAIGDRAVKQVITTILRLNQNPSYQSLRHRIEHVQSIRLSDLEALRQTGMLASLQPVHLANDVPMIEAHWRAIQEEVYPFNSLISKGIPYAFGSDVPIETMNPFAGIYSAIQRKQGLSPDARTWTPKELISVDTALRGYTIGSARASCSEDVLGSIDVGKQADLIVIKDYRSYPDEYWLEVESLLTMVGGTVVHSSL